METIGIDTSIFIYLLEASPRYVKQAERVLRSVELGTVEGVFSSIGMIELLTGPKKMGRYDLAMQYQEMLAHFPHLRIVGIDEAVVEISSDLRARYGIGVADAIHLATAIDAHAGKFVTNDRALARVKDIRIELLSV